MVMLTDFNQKIITDYSPISARGGRRSKKRTTRRHKKSNKSRTRRRYR
jgi:hypothetical protein